MYNIRLSFKPTEINNGWAVYQVHEAKTMKVIFIGIEKVTKIFSMTDFFANHYLKDIIDDDENIAVQVTDLVFSKGEALKQQVIRLREQGYPEANKYSQLSARGLIECIEDGKQYRTMNEVCAAYGVHQSALSKHLRNMTGYLSVKGYHFKRVNNFIKT